MKFLCYTNIELFDKLYNKRNCKFNMEIECTKNGIDIFKGFHYFSPYFLDENHNHEKFLVAINNNDSSYGKNNDGNTLNIVGVICFGRYYSFGNELERISYIDIREDQKNKDICKSLLRELNKYLDSKFDILYYSQLSKDERKCKLDRTIKENINKDVYCY